MELGNVFILYFKPDSKLGNGVAVFNSWFDIKHDDSISLFAYYMAYWVAFAFGNIIYRFCNY